MHNQILNVGDTDGNYRIREIAEIVGGVFPGLHRDGRRTESGRPELPGVVRQDPARCCPTFRCEWNAERSARQLLDVFTRAHLSEEDFRSRDYTRLKQIEHLLREGEIDESLFWT